MNITINDQDLEREWLSDINIIEAERYIKEKEIMQQILSEETKRSPHFILGKHRKRHKFDSYAKIEIRGRKTPRIITNYKYNTRKSTRVNESWY